MKTFFEVENLKKLKENLTKLMRDIDKNVSFLYKIATHDPKTGIHNYLFFQDVFEIELNEAKRGKKKLCLAIFDIDYFKLVNDKYGHIKADKILRKIAEIIRESIRKYDIAARFGGEEFIVMLPDATKEDAKRITGRIRKKIQEKLKRFKITISCGLTEFKTHDTKEKIKERADKALFKAKEKGRNRVEVL